MGQFRADFGLSHLCIALDLGYFSAKEFETLNNQAIRVTRLVGGFFNYLLCDGTEEPKN